MFVGEPAALVRLPQHPPRSPSPGRTNVDSFLSSQVAAMSHCKIFIALAVNKAILHPLFIGRSRPFPHGVSVVPDAFCRAIVARKPSARIALDHRCREFALVCRTPCNSDDCASARECGG
jgi:hypothetical protein